MPHNKGGKSNSLYARMEVILVIVTWVFGLMEMLMSPNRPRHIDDQTDAWVLDLASGKMGPPRISEPDWKIPLCPIFSTIKDQIRLTSHKQNMMGSRFK